VVLLEAKLLRLALAALISVTAKPVTASLNVKVAVNALFVVVPVTLDEIATVGALASYVVEYCVAAVLLLPALSCAIFAGTSTVTVPSAPGVTVAV